MAKLPEEALQPTVEAIYRAYVEARKEENRPHLGASLIGKDCTRALWFDFRWVSASQHEGRMLRLFDTGNHQEPRMVADLKAVGVTVHDTDPEGQQFRVEAEFGHFGGSMDGCALGLLEAPKTWHVLEFKTHGAKSFALLKKDGVEKSKPQHYAQMQIYMHYTGMTRAFYLAVNKDTDELYSERFEYNAEAALRLIAKAKRVIFANRPPSRISDDPAWWQCKFCDHHANCHGETPPARNCRTCAHSTPVEGADSKWICELELQPVQISLTVQRNGCPEYEPHPDLAKETQ